jgi:hypothetical protein
MSGVEVEGVIIDASTLVSRVKVEATPLKVASPKTKRTRTG